MAERLHGPFTDVVGNSLKKDQYTRDPPAVVIGFRSARMHYDVWMTIRVAGVQAAPVFLNREATLDRLEQWARRAASDGVGAKIIAFPETWIPGYPAWIDSSPEMGIWNHEGAKTVFARLMDNSVEVPSAATARIGALAKELGVTLVIGVHERAGRTLYNSLLTFGADGE